MKIGDGITMIFWTDRAAGTIVDVSPSGKTVVIQLDHAKRTDDNGMSECQEYEHSPNPEATRETFTLRANGRWIRKGESLKGQRIVIGTRETYHDFSF